MCRRRWARASGSPSARARAAASWQTDQVVDLEHVWGSAAARLAEDLVEQDEAARLDRVERALFERARRAPDTRSTLDLPGVAKWIRTNPAFMTVRNLADATDVSRQHLARVFRELIGVSPKRYCRLARFKKGLAYVGTEGVNWARAAAELGYSDQSHMIAEFREFSSLTPEVLTRQHWFHPFIPESRSRLSLRSRAL